VRAEWGSQNRAVLVRYLRGLLRTMDWLYTSRDEFVPIAARLLNLEPRYAGIGWDTYTGKAVWPRDARPTMNGIAKVIDILAQQGTFGGNPPPQPGELVDLSYIDEASRTLGSAAR